MPTPKKAAPRAAKVADDADAFMAALDHPLKADIEAVRKLILAAGPGVSDGVKWNSLSFSQADWFATIHLRSRDAVQVVLHTGAKAKDNPDFAIADPKGLLKWLARDRAIATLGAGGELKANAKAFAAIIKAWVGYV